MDSISSNISENQRLRVLKGKHILLIDDSERLITEFLPCLTTATEGKASAILHREQTMNELCQQILNQNPEIILMDFFLSSGIYGNEVVKQLLSQKPDLKIIGFSSSSGGNEEIIQAGAIGAVEKNNSEILETLEQIAGLISDTIEVDKMKKE